MGGMDAGAEQQSFVERIQDPGVRERLAVYLSSNGFYGKLDYGESFDEAFDTSLFLAIGNKNLLDRIVEAGEVPETTWPEEDFNTALDACLAGERRDFEPGRIRKGLARLALKREFRVGKYILNPAPWRSEYRQGIAN